MRAIRECVAIAAIGAILFNGSLPIWAQSASTTTQVNVQQITSRASAGDVTAMVQLGYLYLEGSAVSRDQAAAARWYRAAAEKKHRVAMNNYGWMHEHGIGVARNPVEAALWYQRAAEAGNITAMTNLAQLYKYGLAGVNTPEEAAWYAREVRTGAGRPAGVVRNDAAAMAWFRRAAQAGDGTAMAEMVDMYRYGRSDDDAGERRRDVAISWAEKAAAAGNPHGLFVVASYPRPEPPPPAPPPGRFWTPEEIAAMRTPEARAAQRAARDKRTADQENERMQFLRRAAEMGHSQALSELAGWLRPKWAAMTGEFSANLPPQLRKDADRMRDEAKAYAPEFPQVAGWLRKAANEGDADAMAWFGEWTCRGIGVPKNEPEGVKSILRSVEAGSVQGHLTLSRMHSDGLFAYPKDPAKAREVLQQLATHPQRAGLGKQLLADYDASAARSAQSRSTPWDGLRPALILLAVWAGLTIVHGDVGSGGSGGGGLMLPGASGAGRRQNCRYEAINAQTVNGARSVLGGSGTWLRCD
jgi:uncharacterized protein